MSWKLVKNAFFVKVDGKLKWIDIGVYANCNGIHIPPEEANACMGLLTKPLTYEEIEGIRIMERSLCNIEWKEKIEKFFDGQVNICRDCIWQNDRMSDLRKELLGEEEKVKKA